MAWWRPKEEADPQSRVGQAGRIGTTRPVGEREQEERPAFEQRPPASERPLASVPVYRERRGLPWGAPVIAIVALVFVAVMVLPFVFAFDAFDGLDGDGGSGGGGAPFGGSNDGPSLVPRERFASAMGKVREEAGSEASIQVLRVAPDRIDAIVRRSNGRRANIQVLPDLDVRVFDIGTTGGGERGLSLGRIDAALPERLARRAAERVRARPDDLSYMALAATPMLGGGGIWSIFFNGGTRHAVADLDGSNLRVPGQ
jgi:hypothetical protein